MDAQGDRVLKVMIGMPSGEMVHADFAYDLARLVGYTQLVRPDIAMMLYSVKGTYLPRARNALANEALAKGCSHLLFVDSDMRFPKDALIRLLGHEKSIVAANYPTRQHPVLPTALDAHRNPVFRVEAVETVAIAGMGLMLIDMAVFLAVEKPWFAIGYSKAIDDYSGEDTFFCQKAAQAGHPTWIDGPLSEQVEHCGAFRYAMPHARMTEEAAHGTQHVQ